MDPQRDAVSVRPHNTRSEIGVSAAHSAGGETARLTVASLVQTLTAQIGPARLERDFFNGSIFRQGEHGEVVIRVSSAAAAEVLQRRYGPVLEQIATEHAGSVRFLTELSAVPAALRKHNATSTGAQPSRSGPRQASRRTSLTELVVSNQNRLAVDAARRAAAGTLPAGCLLYIHGACGLGKTHVLNAIVDESASRPGVQARCVSGEQFANEFIGAIKSDKPERVDRFRKQYRSLDILCIDDLQSLQGKNATQQELQHTVDAIAARGGRVVICGSCHPRRLEQISDALVSRLMGGLVAELLPPDPVTAARIVQVLAARRGMTIEGPAAEAIAMAVVNDPRTTGRQLSVRDLEGLVTKVEAVHRLLGAGSVAGDTSAGGAVGMLSVNRALADRPETTRVAGTPGAVLARIGPRQPVRIEQVVSLVCQKLNVTQTEVAGRGRHPRVVLARALATLLARKHTRASYPEIARAVGRPNHSTVITAHQRIEALIAENATADCADGRGVRPIADLIAECSAILASPGGPLGQTQTA